MYKGILVIFHQNAQIHKGVGRPEERECRLLSSSSRDRKPSPEPFGAVLPPGSAAAAIRAGQEGAPPPETPLDTIFKRFDWRKGETETLSFLIVE